MNSLPSRFRKNVFGATTLFLLSVLFFSSCTLSREARDDKGLKTVPPPSLLSFVAIKNQLKNVDWSEPIDGTSLKPTPGIIGYQIGLRIPNLAVALFVRNEKLTKDISQNILELSKAIDIDDEAVLLKIRDHADNIDRYLKDDKDNSYNSLVTELSSIEHLIKTYFADKGNDMVVQQILFGTWLEFLRITTQAFSTHYDERLTGFFSREAEIAYFKEHLKKVKDTKAELAFVTQAGEVLDGNGGKPLSKKEVDEFLKTIKDLRSTYVKN
jgi:hypothetical protein